MPKVYLSDEELKQLSGETDESEPENEMEADEYLEARDRLIAKARADGDEDLVDELLDRFPHPGKLVNDEREAQSRKIAEEEREARRPQSDEDRAAFLRDLNATPDGDKDALRETLRKHGMLHVEEGEIA